MEQQCIISKLESEWANQQMSDSDQNSDLCKDSTLHVFVDILYINESL